MHLSRIALCSFLLTSCAASSFSTGSREELPPSSWSVRLPDPVSAGTTFESAVIETGLEAHVVHQELPSDSVFTGGDFQLYALQARVRLNERVALIATKDGYIDFNPDAGSDEDGFADIAGGVKFLAYEDPEAGLLVTPGLIYETTSGDDEVFQSNGDGLLRPFVSVGWDGGKTNVLSTVGYNLPLDNDEESTSADYHLHVSYEVTPELLPLFELNGITYTSDGDAFVADFEGGDLINLGSNDVQGNTVISGAFGFAWRPSDRIQVGLTYEVPFTSREDLLDNRVWFAVLIRL